MQTIGEIFGSLPGRLGLGIVAIATTALSLPLVETAGFSPEKSMAVLAAIGAWLWAEISTHSTVPHPQDVKLLQDVHILLKDGMGFIRKHDFGNSFNENSINCYYALLDQWKGPHLKFVDKKLQRSWDSVYSSATKFTHLILENCTNISVDTTMLTVKTPIDLQQGNRAPQTLKAAKDINEAADQTVDKWDAFVALGVRRLQVAM
jgi:hypothetical protein